MSEERDLEKELKEEKDRFERQNQEAYDKEVSGEAELKRQEEKRIRKGEKRRYQRLKRKQTQTGGNTGEKFIPDKTGDFAPAPDRDMRTGEPIYDPETDQFGNQGPVVVQQTKEERDAKVEKTYLGNVKVVWTNGDNVAVAPRQDQPVAQAAPAAAAAPVDDLPF